MEFSQKLIKSLVLIISLFLTEGINRAISAPQGSELYQELKEIKLAGRHTINQEDNQEVNSYVDHHIEIREAINKAEILRAEEKKSSNCGDSVEEKRKHDLDEHWEHHIQIREAVFEDEGPNGAQIKNVCAEALVKAADPEHTISVRQTEESGNRGELDAGSEDLVTSLLRQRDDFIAAAAIPERPLPVQNIRLNLNSGL